jgi:hypothetical protein
MIFTYIKKAYFSFDNFLTRMADCSKNSFLFVLFSCNRLLKQILFLGFIFHQKFCLYFTQQSNVSWNLEQQHALNNISPQTCSLISLRHASELICLSVWLLYMNCNESSSFFLYSRPCSHTVELLKWIWCVFDF